MYLLDTNVLLKYPSALKTFEGKVAISIRVLEELDGLKRNANPEVAYQARRASHKVIKGIDNIHFITNVDRNCTVDDSLIALAKKKGYTLVSIDLNVIIKCRAKKVSCQSYDKGETNYTGVKYYTVELDEDLYNETLEEILDKGISPFEMRENEFLIV